MPSATRPACWVGNVVVHVVPSALVRTLPCSVWQKSETYAPERGAPLTWLLTIARYRALDLLRSKRPEVEMPEESEAPPLTLADPGEDPAQRAVESEGLGRLQRCLGGLEDEQRRSLLLAYYEGYTHQELARAMAAPLGTVKSWVRRGLSRLRECLEAAAAYEVRG